MSNYNEKLRMYASKKKEEGHNEASVEMYLTNYIYGNILCLLKLVYNDMIKVRDAADSLDLSIEEFANYALKSDKMKFAEFLYQKYRIYEEQILDGAISDDDVIDKNRIDVIIQLVDEDKLSIQTAADILHMSVGEINDKLAISQWQKSTAQ